MKGVYIGLFNQWLALFNFCTWIPYFSRYFFFLGEFGYCCYYSLLGLNPNKPSLFLVDSNGCPTADTIAGPVLLLGWKTFCYWLYLSDVIIEFMSWSTTFTACWRSESSRTVSKALAVAFKSFCLLPLKIFLNKFTKKLNEISYS